MQYTWPAVRTFSISHRTKILPPPGEITTSIWLYFKWQTYTGGVNLFLLATQSFHQAPAQIFAMLHTKWIVITLQCGNPSLRMWPTIFLFLVNQDYNISFFASLEGNIPGSCLPVAISNRKVGYLQWIRRKLCEAWVEYVAPKGIIKSAYASYFNLKLFCGRGHLCLRGLPFRT